MQNLKKTLALLTLFFLTGCSRLETTQEIGGETFVLNKDKPVGQSFTAKNDGLNMIKLWVNNPNLTNHSPLVFHLRKEGEEEDLARISFSGDNIGASSWLPLKFSPIFNSNGGKFYFFIEQLKISEREKSIEFSRSVENVYPSGNAFVNHEPSDGDLTFRSYYYLSFQRFWLVSLQEFWQRFLSDSSFAIFYFALVLILVILIIKFF